MYAKLLIWWSIHVGVHYHFVGIILSNMKFVLIIQAHTADSLYFALVCVYVTQKFGILIKKMNWLTFTYNYVVVSSSTYTQEIGQWIPRTYVGVMPIVFNIYHNYGILIKIRCAYVTIVVFCNMEWVLKEILTAVVCSHARFFFSFFIISYYFTMRSFWRSSCKSNKYVVTMARRVYAYWFPVFYFNEIFNNSAICFLSNAAFLSIPIGIDKISISIDGVLKLIILIVSFQLIRIPFLVTFQGYINNCSPSITDIDSICIQCHMKYRLYTIYRVLTDPPCRQRRWSGCRPWKNSMYCQ